jgi:hypothetical protein
VRARPPLRGARRDRSEYRSTEVPLPAWWLRVGLGFVFAYAAVAAFLSPEAFSAYLPAPPGMGEPGGASMLCCLRAGAGRAFLSGRHTHAASLAAVVTLAGIVVFNLDALDVLFRNVAVACAAAALACSTRGDDAYVTGRPSTASIFRPSAVVARPLATVRGCAGRADATQLAGLGSCDGRHTTDATRVTDGPADNGKHVSVRSL